MSRSFAQASLLAMTLGLLPRVDLTPTRAALQASATCDRLASAQKVAVPAASEVR